MKSVRTWKDDLRAHDEEIEELERRYWRALVSNGKVRTPEEQEEKEYCDYELQTLQHSRAQLLRTVAISRGLMVPVKLLDKGSDGRELTSEGEAWVRRELKKERRETIEFWAKLILPIVSILVAIASSVVALVALLHRH